LDVVPLFLLAASATSSSVQSLAYFTFSHWSWKHGSLQEWSEEGGVSLLVFSMAPLGVNFTSRDKMLPLSLLLHDPVSCLTYQSKARHQMLQHTKQKDEQSLWAACCTHLLGFCALFQMVLSKR